MCFPLCILFPLIVAPFMMCFLYVEAYSTFKKLIFDYRNTNILRMCVVLLLICNQLEVLFKPPHILAILFLPPIAPNILKSNENPPPTKMTILMRETLSYDGCEQHRRRPAWAWTQSDQRLCFSLFEKYHIQTCCKQNFNFLASHCS